MNTHNQPPESLERIGQQHVQHAPQAFIDIDVEADGIAGYGSLLSLGAVSPWGETFYTELRPMHTVYIPENRAFSDAHGLAYDRLQREGEDPLQAFTDFSVWTQQVIAAHDKKTAVFTAYNASYDFPLVDAYYKQLGLKNPYGHAAFCIKSLAMVVAGSRTWDWAQTGKGSLPAELVPNGDFTHNALEDAKYQQKIHFRLAGLLHRYGIFTE